MRHVRLGHTYPEHHELPELFSGFLRALSDKPAPAPQIWKRSFLPPIGYRHPSLSATVAPDTDALS